MLLKKNNKKQEKTKYTTKKIRAMVLPSKKNNKKQNKGNGHRACNEIAKHVHIKLPNNSKKKNIIQLIEHAMK